LGAATGAFTIVEEGELISNAEAGSVLLVSKERNLEPVIFCHLIVSVDFRNAPVSGMLTPGKSLSMGSRRPSAAATTGVRQYEAAGRLLAEHPAYFAVSGVKRA
jgi:hypothetical protein